MKPMDRRLTRLKKNGVPELRNSFHSERAIALLYAYENTGYTPKQILELVLTIQNLQDRIKKLEEWQ